MGTAQRDHYHEKQRAELSGKTSFKSDLVFGSWLIIFITVHSLQANKADLMLKHSISHSNGLPLVK